MDQALSRCPARGRFVGSRFERPERPGDDERRTSMSAVEAPTRSTPTKGLRRMATVAATAGFGVLLFLSELLDPVGEGTPENLLSAATSSSGAMTTSSLLLLVSSILLVPAVVAIVRLTPKRGAALANAGAILLVMGALGHAMAATFYLVVAALPGTGLEHAELTKVLQHLDAAPSLAVSFLFIVSFGFGVLFSFIGLRRAGAVPLWVLGAVIAAFLMEVAAPGGHAIALVKQALGVVAFGYLAYAVARPQQVDLAD